MRSRPILRSLAAAAALAFVAVSCGGDDDEPATEAAPATDAAAATDAAGTAAATPATDAESEPEPAAEPTLEGELVGLFTIDPGVCDVAGSETGSFFRMVAIDGTAEDGPFVPNGDSPCADQTFIPLLPGTDGGLLTGTYQPGEDPSFDDEGNATADQIAAPTQFFGVAFGMATTDEASPPMIVANAGALSGDLAAVSAYYAGEVFNQGSPKPDGSAPGETAPSPSGSIDGETGSYELAWASQIIGGAFNDFTGVWHLEGSFASGA
ncbi:MAG: hypothetical protein ACR2O6_00740 [Ilumatobacteraceae bacterium]